MIKRISYTAQGKAYRFKSEVEYYDLPIAMARPAVNTVPMVVFSPSGSKDLADAPAGLIPVNSAPLHLTLTIPLAGICPYSYTIGIFNNVIPNVWSWNSFIPWQFRDQNFNIINPFTSRQARRLDCISNPTQMFSSLSDQLMYDEDFYLPQQWNNFITMPGNYNQAGYMLLSTATGANTNSLNIAPIPNANDWTILKIFNYWELCD